MAHAAGLTAVTTTASVWLFATPEDRAWWGGAWAERVLQSQFATDALDGGYATPGELRAISRAWHEWAAHDAVVTMTHVEIVATI